MQRTMKTALFTTLAVVATLFLAPTTRADDFTGVQRAKAVWNFTKGDEKIFLDRIQLIKQTADGLRKKGIEPDFVIILHGAAAKFATKTLAGTKFAKDKLAKLAQTQETLKSLKDSGTNVEICKIALDRGKIKNDNVQPFAVIQENVFENLITLQNKGYAYMEVD